MQSVKFLEFFERIDKNVGILMNNYMDYGPWDINTLWKNLEIGKYVFLFSAEMGTILKNFLIRFSLKFFDASVWKSIFFLK